MKRYKVDCPKSDCDWHILSNMNHDQAVVDIMAFHYANHPAEKKTLDDLRGIPTFACICGCKMFRIIVMWDEETRAVGWYGLTQECIECGTTTTAPTPIDDENDDEMECV